IVNYIVKNTVGPVVDEKWKEAEANKKSFMDATLSVKVLDPAMGSGHFLVGSIEYLADRLLKAAQEDINAGRLYEEAHLTPDWARREVVAHCIYGVDLNDLAVELAKVSLWLTTISKDKPLSFLDHRLKQGNSLIGARLSDLKTYPGAKKMEKDQTMLPSFISPLFITHLIGKITELEKIKDERLEDIKRKEKVFEEFKQLPEYRKAKALANVYTGVYFGNEVTPTQNKDSANVYYDLFWAIMGDENEWRRKTNRDWFVGAEKIAQEKSFFHWELEFPELFFEGGAPKEAPGWDAVVGNPPYDVLSAKERGEEEEKLQYELDYFKGQISGFSGKLNLYRLMSERSYSYLRDSGRFGFIIPNTVMADQSSAPLRKFLFENSKEISFLEFPEKARVFTDVTQAVCIVVAQKGTPKAEEIFLASGLKTGSDLLAPKFFNLKLKEILEIDGEYYLPYVSEKSIDLFRKLLDFPRIGNLSELSIFQGEVNLTNYKECIKTNDGAQLIRGDHLSRYELIFNTEKPSYLDVQCYLTKAGDAEKAKHHKSQRIAFQEVANMQLSRRLNATLIEQNQFLSHTTNYFMVKNNYSIYFILALFNSQLLNWRFKLTSTTNHVSGGESRRLPIRRISFTTPPARRAVLVDEAKALYSEFLQVPDSQEFDRINRMDRIDSHPVNPVHPVQTVASFSAAPDNQKILEFIGARLAVQPEESDVVHDLLAYLAERMIEMNREKNAEIKGFLEFLKGEIGAPIDDLSNKTAIQEYYTHQFQNLVDVLVKNKKKLKAGYDPKSPANYKHLLEWYTASMDKLKPLRGRIEATDGLIDAIVYRLYGLTEDEIKIVEESIKTTGGKGISEES
ncbi:MAG: Eco57I restriction-modification methylase domain-containing protein, partial [Euryarchaeota archaeon]|nr:Eco57I restriction-modification methylase domain-containing protein [Euryarchaeota archaeon]